MLSRGTGCRERVEAVADGPVSLKVQKLNRPAIAFYERRGFAAYAQGDADQPGGGWLRMGPPELLS